MSVGLFKEIPASQEGIDTGQLLTEYGEAVYVTTATTVEVRTQLTGTLTYASFTPKTVTHDPQDLLISDGVVTSGAVTVVRAASGTSALTFMYKFTGVKT